MRLYHQYPPCARVSQLVECYWVFRAAADVCGVEKLIPGGRVEMIFHFGSPYTLLAGPESSDGETGTRIHFMGQRDRIFYGRPNGYTDMLGVRFKPGGLAALTDLPLSALLNRMIPAEDMLGCVIKGWEDRLYALQEDTQRVLLLDHLLSALMSDLPKEHAVLQPALSLIRQNPDYSSVKWICEQTGWYYKKLERAFNDQVGYTPKQYCRIIRFNKALRQMEFPKKTSLTDLAYACGYYDQSHFIKEFSRYAGTVPGNFTLTDQSMAEYLIRYQNV